MNILVSPVMTTEEMLALPDDGKRRWLIDGKLREEPMTVRNRWHSRVMARISHLLVKWLDQQLQPRGSVLCGEVGIILRRNPDVTVGIDVVYISADLAAHHPDDTTLIDGVPVLVVEILSPSTKEEDTNEKLDAYRRAGVPLVWLVDPHDRTVLIYRPGTPPTLVNEQQELSGEPELPGFRVPAAQLFV
jgi:Uma2 family endonuclease